MLVQGIEILDCIPQRPPVVMIDKLLYTDHEKAITGLLVKETNIFSVNGFLSESGLVENIAQTAAAGVGYLCKLENTKVPVGFIASIKDLKIYHLPANGTEIITEVAVTN
ncbi:MAG TPA: hydroxymyristoyl-ACP dehydratase, partial [Bacteroidia bacterium]|nr:hydroxymyristoyl-ACP dehydratase [Bacteroidia bacterium]